MGKRELRLAKLHRENAKLLATIDNQKRQLGRLAQKEREWLESPPKLSPLAESVAITVRKINPDRYHPRFDQWVASVSFCPDAFAYASLHEDSGPLNVSYLAADVARRIEYDVRQAILKAMDKARGFGD